MTNASQDVGCSLRDRPAGRAFEGPGGNDGTNYISPTDEMLLAGANALMPLVTDLSEGYLTAREAVREVWCAMRTASLEG